MELIMASYKKDESVEHVGDCSHSSHLLSGLDDLRNQATFCDVTIIVGEQRFPAHKAVLTSASDYFRGMFSSGFQESTMSEVTVHGTAESFAQILNFIYTGYFTLTPGTVVGILETACYMVMTRAVKLCAEYLMKFQDKFTVVACFEVWSIAMNHANLSDVAQLYRRRVVQHFLLCVVSKAFLENCTARVMIEILGDEDIEADTITEEYILEGTLIWLRHDWEQRKVHAVDILKQIRLGLIPIDRLHQILGDELLSIPECKDLVAKVVHLNDTMNTTSPLLMRSHPDLFATRNTITATIYLDENVEASTMISMLCKTKSGHKYKLTDMADLPHIYPYEENDRLSNYMTMMVSDAGYLYAGGGKDMAYSWYTSDDYDKRRFDNWDWLEENNFYRYDPQTNKWITLPPMKDARFALTLHQVDEYIYALGVPDNKPDFDMAMERYSFAKEEWELISCGIGFGISSIAVVDGYILMKGPNSPRQYNDKVALYKMAENKVYKVDACGDFETYDHLANHDNEVYLKTKAGNFLRLACNFAGDNPSIGITDEIVEDGDIIKAVQDQLHLGEGEFTFDKGRLGMMPI